MKHLFFAVVLLGVLCSCAHKSEPGPVYAGRFYTEKDAFLPNGWICREDSFYKKPKVFEVKSYRELGIKDAKYDEGANVFTVRTEFSPSLYYYCGYYDVNDDTIIDIDSNATGKGSFSIGVEFYDADRNFLGERHQGFTLLPVSGDRDFKNYHYRFYFLANENRKARYVRLVFIAEPNTELTLRDISLSITPYEIDLKDSTYIKFKEKEARQK